MATFTDAQIRASFDQKWDMQFLQARYAEYAIMPRVLNKSAMLDESGEVVNITIKPRVSGGDVGSDGGFTPETLSLSNVQINVNTWKYVSHVITDKQAKQSIATLQSELSKQFGSKLAEFSEIDLANLFLNFSGFSGVAGQGLGTPGSGVTFLEDTALAAVKALRLKQIPLDDCSWILNPEAFYDGWLTKERMTSAYATGEAKSLLTTGVSYGKGFKQTILGIPAFESTLLNGAATVNIDTNAQLNGATAPNVAGTTAAALIHREALGIAVQINNKTEVVRTTPASQFATLVASNLLYGVKTVRANHGVLIYVKNT